MFKIDYIITNKYGRDYNWYVSVLKSTISIEEIIFQNYNEIRP